MREGEDVLTILDRALDKTPEHAYAGPPLPRRVIAAAAAEIRMLRARLAQKAIEHKQAD